VTADNRADDPAGFDRDEDRIDALERLGRSGEQQIARWEFRCWLPARAARPIPLPSHWHELPGERRADIYLLTLREAPFLTKLRDGARVDVKTILSREDDLELWRPHYDAAFPLAHEQVRALFDLLAPPDVGRSSDHMTAALSERRSEISVRLVRTARRRYSDDSVIFEIVEVALIDRRATSICIEAENVGKVRELRGRLGLEHHPNINYGAFIRG